MTISQRTVLASMEFPSAIPGLIQTKYRTEFVDDAGNVLGTGAAARSMLAPGDDLTSHDPRVVAAANAAWTPAVVALYQAAIQPVGQPLLVVAS